MKQFSNYSKVDKKYRWDLEDILQGKTLQFWMDKFKDLFKQLIETKDSKYDNIDSFIKSLETQDELTLVYNKINNYLSNKTNENLVDNEIQKLCLAFNSMNEELHNEYGSEINRLYKHIEKLKVWIQDERLQKYKRNFDDLLESYNHKLSDDVEEFIVKSSYGMPNIEDMFSILTDVELDYKPAIDSKNKKHVLDLASFPKLAKSDDALLRKNAVLQYKKAKLQVKETLATMLIQEFKSISTDAKLRKYKSSIDMLTFSDKVSDELLINLFNHVASLKYDLRKYASYHKKFYETKFHEKYRNKYDAYRELIKIKTNYTIEDIQNIAKKVFASFPQEYVNKIHEAIDNNWIDYMMVKNKLSGAYSIGETYGIDKKYILMNFDGELSSLETLCHELGHSMHSYYSDKNNDIINANYPIILAEIASLFNELMLYDYLLKTSKDDKFKFYIYGKMIDGFIGSVVTQTMWANYEYDLYNKVDKNEVASSYEEVAKVYYDSTRKYTCSKKKFNANDCIAAVSVPHFYMGFYVYKYAFGQLVANYFYSKYKEDASFLQKYIDNFLSVGNRYYPLETLKRLGVDFMDEDFYTHGFAYFKTIINEWIKLGKKIFKSKK